MKTIREALEAVKAFSPHATDVRRAEKALKELDAAESDREKTERRAVEAEQENATLAQELRLAREKMAAMEKRLAIGAQMANLCFNLGQESGPEVTKHHREVMHDLAKKWDGAR